MSIARDVAPLSYAVARIGAVLKTEHPRYVMEVEREPEVWVKIYRCPKCHVTRDRKQVGCFRAGTIIAYVSSL